MTEILKRAQCIQIGIIGCGGMGRILAQAVAASGLGHICAVFDPDLQKRQALAQAHGAEAAASEDELLAMGGMQAVIIATPPALHRENALKAVQAGVHIFLEKPMALDSSACRQLNQAIQQAGLTLMVGQALRYFEPFRTITRCARQGYFGKPQHGSIWRMENSYLRLARWKGQRHLSGGYLYEIGAHELDWMRCLFGEATDVHAILQKKWPSEHEIEDLVSLQLQFESGAVATYLGGTGFPSSEYGFCLRFEWATVSSASAFDPAALKVEWFHPLGMETEKMAFSTEDPFETEMRDWLESLIDGSPVPIPGEDAIQTIALIESAYSSANLS